MVTDLFNSLEQKLEQVMAHVKSLTEENKALIKELADRENAFKEAQEALAKASQEREQVRQRIDKILNRLKFLETGESA